MNTLELIHPYHFVVGVVSTMISLVLVVTTGVHGKHTLDTHQGVQKFHTIPTPRIGGIAILLAIVLAWFILPDCKSGLLGLMLLAGLPAFSAGLLEDLTKKVSVNQRLFATMLSGLSAWVLTDYSLTTVAIPGVDTLLAWLPLSVLFTAFAVAGIANAINIIDGFNGLAAGVLIICFSLFGVIAYNVGDHELARICLVLVVAVTGFMVINFPYGKIFMGDGGAYLMGFLLAWTAVMLPMRNPKVSVWAPIVICAYPLIETLYSIARRFAQKHNPGHPDSQHLHSLIKVRIIRPYFGQLPQHIRNSMVSPFCWALSLVFSLPALFAYGNTSQLMLISLCCVLLYAAVYCYVSRLPEKRNEA